MVITHQNHRRQNKLGRQTECNGIGHIFIAIMYLLGNPTCLFLFNKSMKWPDLKTFFVPCSYLSNWHLGLFRQSGRSQWDNPLMEAITSAWRRWGSQWTINFIWHWMDNISKCIYRCTAAGLAGIKGIKIRPLFTVEAYYPNAPQLKK